VFRRDALQSNCSDYSRRQNDQGGDDHRGQHKRHPERLHAECSRSIDPAPANGIGDSFCRAVCKKVRTGDNDGEHGRSTGEAGEFVSTDPADNGGVYGDVERFHRQRAKSRPRQRQESPVDPSPLDVASMRQQGRRPIAV
jgi:hypothetical protein